MRLWSSSWLILQRKSWKPVSSALTTVSLIRKRLRRLSKQTEHIIWSCSTEARLPSRIWRSRSCRIWWPYRRRRTMRRTRSWSWPQPPAIPERQRWLVLQMLREPELSYFTRRTASAVCRSCRCWPRRARTQALSVFPETLMMHRAVSRKSSVTKNLPKN